MGWWKGGVGAVVWALGCVSVGVWVSFGFRLGFANGDGIDQPSCILSICCAGFEGFVGAAHSGWVGRDGMEWIPLFYIRWVGMNMPCRECNTPCRECRS